MGDLFVGVAGWSYADWHGTVYPRERGKRDELAYLSRFFRVLEVNSTFYQIPPPARTESWVRRVATRDRFLFTVKAWHGFTHDEPGTWGGEEIRGFREALRPLVEADRLGAVLLQYPWNFAFDDAGRDRLSRAAGGLLGLPLVVEVRHRSWDTPEGRTFLRDRRLSLCSVDQPESKTSLPREAYALGDLGYVRLHGRNRATWFDRDAGRDQKYNYLYDESELREWAFRIRELARAVPRTFVIANNHYRGQAPANALELFAMLAEEPVEVPQTLVETYPRLVGIRKPAGPEHGRMLFE